jgi:transposase-like protein
MQNSKPLIRERHSSELKALLLAKYTRPGSSVAQIAKTHGLKANFRAQVAPANWRLECWANTSEG